MGTAQGLFVSIILSCFRPAYARDFAVQAPSRAHAGSVGSHVSAQWRVDSEGRYSCTQVDRAYGCHVYGFIHEYATEASAGGDLRISSRTRYWLKALGRQPVLYRVTGVGGGFWVQHKRCRVHGRSYKPCCLSSHAQLMCRIASAHHHQDGHHQDSG